jgi:hypothetical protein
MLGFFEITFLKNTFCHEGKFEFLESKQKDVFFILSVHKFFSPLPYVVGVFAFARLKRIVS